ncbi:ABC transporter permease [Brucepastera parasyntrophica]|uniref:ABC transporter permease n=1 Tax=Brucepastera parasyntrophica TaxID=2880008 RepID=UPI00210EE43C|nr:ABC transporter permease [Brucepastera parasyntrophica]ULQ58506.1 ABC transporter permease [Brucepastera parasyntrophica]
MKQQLRAFIKKEFLHILRDARTAMILLIMPVSQIILFGFAISTEVKNSRVAVYDPSRDTVTEHIANRMNASGYFEISSYLRHPDEINDIFKHEAVNLVMVFSENFSDNLLNGESSIQLIADGTDPNQATTVISYASGVISSYQQELMEGYNIPIMINTESKMLYNPQLKSSYSFVPGVMGLIMILICAMMTSISIVREKETGTMELLLVSPIKPLYIIIAKLTPYFVISIVNLTTILLLSVFVLKVPVEGNLFVLIGISLIYIVLSLAVGLLISTLTNSQAAAMIISAVVLMAPVMMLSGMMFPVENLPVVLRVLSYIIPASWYLNAVKKVMIEGLGLGAVLLEFSVLIGMAAVFLTISLKKFKTRLG